jgi:hypothetical protein
VTLSIAAYAQEFRGTISGTVIDPAGAVVANAKITAVETGTNTKVSTVSDSRGEYALPFLAPGKYDLTIESAGFRQAVQSGIQLGSGEHPVIDVHMVVGDVSQKMEVTEDAPMVNTENSIVQRYDGEFVGRIERRLRGDKRPGASAGVCGAKVNGGNQPEQCEFMHESC